MMAVGMPATPTTAATRMSMFFDLRLRIVPMIEVGMITAADVPLAITGISENRTIMAGTITTPPPIPSRPANTPVAKPTAIMATAVRNAMASRPLASVGM